MHLMRSGAILLAMLAALIGSGCASPPIDRTRITDPALTRIADAFTTIVADAHADPSVDWVCGWSGNSRVKAAGDGSVRGLCYEWQELIYPRILPVCAEVGWEAAGITINFGWFSEHHAVVVWNPATVSKDALLASEHRGAWVLDAWQRAAADIYTLDDWLDIPWIVFEPASLEEVGPLQ